MQRLDEKRHCGATGGARVATKEIEVKKGIDRVEQCADEAERAIQSGSVTGELRQSVDAMHQQARQAQQVCSG